MMPGCFALFSRFWARNLPFLCWSWYLQKIGSWWRVHGDAHGVVRGAARRAFAIVSLGMLLLIFAPVGNALAAPMPVVASFSILGDMVHQIGGSHVAVMTIVGPDADAHAFEPTPKDARALSHARLLFVNGLAFESWLPKLKKAAGFKGVTIVASKGVEPRTLSDQEMAVRTQHDPTAHASVAAIDPHAWQSLDNGIIYAQNIAAGLAQADPAHAHDYFARAKQYMEQMKTLDVALKQQFHAIPGSRRKVVTSHDAFGYFGRAYGIRFIAVQGLSEEAQPSAKTVAAIIDMVKKDHVPAVFIENISNPKLIKRIAQETGAKIGGTLYSDALAPAGQPASTYLGMFKWNAKQLLAAFAPASPVKSGG